MRDIAVKPPKKGASAGKKWIWVAVGAAVLALTITLPLPESVLQVSESVALTLPGRKALGVLLFCLVLWMTEALPFHVTGFLGMVLLAFLGTDTFANIGKLGFGNDIVLFLIGVLTLSSFITNSGLGKRISLFILSKTGNKPKYIILGFMIAGCLISMWVTDLAVAAMLMPLARSILEDEGVKPMESKFGKALMIACAWGPLIGGVGTPAGAGPNPIAISLVADMTGVEISFVDWMIYGVPTALLLVIPSWLILITCFKPEMATLKKTNEEMKEEFRNYPPMSRNEIVTVIVFAITVVLWLASNSLSKLIGIKIPTALPAIIALCLFFFPGVTGTKWSAIQNDIAWEGILLTATGICIGMEVYECGASDWLAVQLFGNITSHPVVIQIFLIVLLVSILKVGLASNTVTASVIIPIIVSLTQTAGVAVLPIVIPASITLSLAFILVTSSTTNVVPYMTGYFSIADFAKAGILNTLAACVVVTLSLFAVGNITGIF